MKILIRKNKHYPFPYFNVSLPKWISKNKITKIKKSFIFTESCLYDLHNEDQLDVNKLFGFSIGWHHNTSFRFGWRANLETKQIEILTYEYHDGIRQKPILIQKLDINKKYVFELSYIPHLQMSCYKVSDFDTIHSTFNLKRKYGLGYTLGLYFGGNQKAPHKMTFYINV